MRKVQSCRSLVAACTPSGSVVVMQIESRALSPEPCSSSCSVLTLLPVWSGQQTRTTCYVGSAEPYPTTVAGSQYPSTAGAAAPPPYEEQGGVAHGETGGQGPPPHAEGKVSESNKAATVRAEVCSE